ncbi:MAG: hypothetical protein FJ206_01435 [Gemmatimonadetes bacterium]|nr:hypothetical protein [Gemmatimonadota bacterium]
MTSPFRGPDPRVTEGLRHYFDGPDPGTMLSRLEVALGRLPVRDSSWDVLAAWARPRVLGAAMAAAVLLGLALWRGWGQEERTQSPISVAILEAPRPGEVNPVMHTVLEEGP